MKCVRSTDHRVRVRLGYGFGDGHRPLRAMRPVEGAHRAVPEDRPCVAERLPVPVACPGADIEADPAVGKLVDRADAGVGVVEPRGADDIDR